MAVRWRVVCLAKHLESLKACPALPKFRCWINSAVSRKTSSSIARNCSGNDLHHQEAARLAALTATGILDTAPESNYDAITRLAVEYFQADSAGIGFADESRVWMKSSWGHHVRELPRKNSIFEMVLAQDGPVVAADISKQHPFQKQSRLPRLVEMAFFASVPVRSFDGRILGVLTVYWCAPRQAMSPDDLRMLESLASMVASQLELRRLRNAFTKHGVRRLRAPVAGAGTSQDWPRKADLRHALEQRQFVLYYQPEVDLSTRKIVGIEALIRWEHRTGGWFRLWSSFRWPRKPG